MHTALSPSNKDDPRKRTHLAHSAETGARQSAGGTLQALAPRIGNQGPHWCRRRGGCRRPADFHLNPGAALAGPNCAHRAVIDALVVPEGEHDFSLKGVLTRSTD